MGGRLYFPVKAIVGILLVTMSLPMQGSKKGVKRRVVEWHVAVNGNDAADGSLSTPLRSIQAAANKAYPGDIITVHSGIYRERVTPPRGGLSKDLPIVYQSAKGEKVEIKGSEIIKGWKKLNDMTWEVAVPNSAFGSFNPYADTLHGDWLERGQWCHTGEVYLNDVALMETPSLENVLLNRTGQPLWYSKVDKDSTWIWANFRGVNPNHELVEINVRQSVFYPETPFINYITVRGFKMSQAATPWAPPTAEQIGVIGTHWSKGWIIEDNIITHSKCVGITLGKYGDEWDNQAESVDGFIGTTKRALANKWSREYVGSHLVRNNKVSYCGQAGIAGSLGAVYSTIQDNVIHDIGRNTSFWGYELAGIKLHAAVDVLINHNHIYRTEGGIWLDWMAQGTRVTRNFLHDNKVQDLSLEVNHGPVLVDNNLFLSEELAQVKLSQGIAFVHNLIAWKVWPTGKVDERKTPYLLPHDTQIAGYHDCPCGNVSYLNNVFTREDLSAYKECSLPVYMDGNILDSLVRYKIEHTSEGWYLEFTPSENLCKQRVNTLINICRLPEATIPGQTFCIDDKEVTLDRDYLGNKRRKKRNCPGAFEFQGEQSFRMKVFDNY